MSPRRVDDRPLVRVNKAVLMSGSVLLMTGCKKRWWELHRDKFLDLCNGLGAPAIEIIPVVE